MERQDCSFGTLGFHIPYWNRSRTGSSESNPSITTELEGIQPPPDSAKRKFQSCTVRDSQGQTGCATCPLYREGNPIPKSPTPVPTTPRRIMNTLHIGEVGRQTNRKTPSQTALITTYVFWDCFVKGNRCKHRLLESCSICPATLGDVQASVPVEFPRLEDRKLTACGKHSRFF